MEYSEMFERMWQVYSSQNPSVKKIHQLFEKEGEVVENDHVAFRTFSDKRVNIEVLSKPFVRVGYQPVGSYVFVEKKLRAVHLENKTVLNAPKVFISELELEKCSTSLRDTVSELLDACEKCNFNSEELFISGAIWGKVSYANYLKLIEESEYAAWLYVYGFRPNHFTINVNNLKKYNNLNSVNRFLKDNGFKLNTSGGEIKGTPEVLLEQSSTLADVVEVDFIEEKKSIPACYYEFAKRYADKDGKLFNGFIASSADKIFESTDNQESK